MDREPSTMRVVTANIASGRDGGGYTGLPHVSQEISGLDADLVAVQEVDHLLPRSGSVDQATSVARVCAGAGPAWDVRFAAALHGTPGPGGGSRPASRTRPDEPSYGIALLSPHPVTWLGELRLAPARGRRPIPLPPGSGGPPLWWIPDEQRVALAVRVDGPAGALTVVTTHLSFAPVRAALQLRELRRWVAMFPRPLVVLGDLNLPGDLPRRLTGWTAAARSPTFPAGRPRVQLDHVLTDGRLTSSGQAVAVGGSDHRALVVDLRRS